MTIKYTNEQNEPIELNSVNYIVFLENGTIISVNYDFYSKTIRIPANKILSIKLDKK